MKVIVVINLCLVFSVYCKTISVKTAAELKSALSSAAAGDTIELADGTYKGETFNATKSGTSGSPITLTGGKGAIVSGSNYGFHLLANYWVLKGFTVANANKGIVLDGANHNTLDSVEVHTIQDEGIHFRWGSADNTLKNSKIHDTGKGNAGFGEGVYIGSAFHNWQNGKQDKSDRNKVTGNTFGPNVAAENIDIKEGSCCGTITGNTLSGTGEQGEHYADSWLDCKGENYTIEDNTGNHPYKNGFEIHYISESGVGGCNNKILNNKCNGLPSGGKCVENTVTKCTNSIQS